MYRVPVETVVLFNESALRFDGDEIVHCGLRSERLLNRGSKLEFGDVLRRLWEWNNTKRGDAFGEISRRVRSGPIVNFTGRKNTH